MFRRKSQEAGPEPESSSRLRRIIAVPAILAAVIGFVVENNHSEKVESAEQFEMDFFDLKRHQELRQSDSKAQSSNESPLKCLDALVVLEEDDVKRNPRNISGLLPVLMEGNEADLSNGDGPVPVKRPIVLTEDGQDVRLGFDSSSGPQKPRGTFATSRELQEAFNWADYGPEARGTDAQGQGNIETYELPDSDSSGNDTVDCKITFEGQVVTADGEPAAYITSGYEDILERQPGRP